LSCRYENNQQDARSSLVRGIYAVLYLGQLVLLIGAD